MDLGLAMTIFALAFGAWAWVVMYGVRFMKSGIHEMKSEVLIDLGETKKSVNDAIGNLERHMSRELAELRVQQAKTSEVQSAHIHQTERRLTMLETEFNYVKMHMLNKAAAGKSHDT